MRILGFTKRWSKLNKDEFTTFRFPRRDKDWFVGEKVQVVLKPRSEDREWLVVAQIIAIEKRNAGFGNMPGIKSLTIAEAINDGFENRSAMIAWLYNLYGDRTLREPMNSIQLKWIERPNDD